MSDFLHPSLEEILKIHADTLGLARPLDVPRVASCLASIDYLDSVEEKIASITRSLVQNHYFPDANKRTATIVFVLLCQLNDVTNHLVGMELANAIVNIAESMYDVEQVRDLLFTK